MASAATTEYPTVTLAAKVLDCVDKLRNAGVTNSSVYEIIASISNLFDHCNAKFLKDFPVNILYKPSNTYQTEIKSWYQPNLNLTNIHEFIVSTFEKLESDSYHTPGEISTRCIDAIRVLVDYTNAVVLWRINRCLELQEKKSDELQSSDLVETSSHLANGDDYG